MTHGLVDSSDAYRAALVQGVAGLESFVRGLILDRAVDILLGRAPTGSASANSKVGLHFVAVRELVAATSAADAELAARTHLAERLSKETYQRPDAIAAGLAMVGVSKVWSTAFGAGSQSAITALGLVVERRNRIVHSCDADPLSPGQVTSILPGDALAAIATAGIVANGINSLM